MFSKEEDERLLDAIPHTDIPFKRNQIPYRIRVEMYKGLRDWRHSQRDTVKRINELTRVKIVDDVKELDGVKRMLFNNDGGKVDKDNPFLVVKSKDEQGNVKTGGLGFGLFKNTAKNEQKKEQKQEHANAQDTPKSLGKNAPDTPNTLKRTLGTLDTPQSLVQSPTRKKTPEKPRRRSTRNRVTR